MAMDIIRHKTSGIAPLALTKRPISLNIFLIHNPNEVVPGLVVEEVDEKPLHDCVHNPCWNAIKIFGGGFP